MRKASCLKSITKNSPPWRGENRPEIATKMPGAFLNSFADPKGERHGCLERHAKDGVAGSPHRDVSAS